ncbi:hypothetical protein JW877_02380, partial [bacterium]|nr:hypothetical protein [bacterium]
TLMESTAVDLYLASSMDGTTWSGWVPLTPGEIVPPILGRYFRYMTQMTGYTYHQPVLHWALFTYLNQGPLAELNYPFPEAVSSCPDQNVSLFITDENGVNPSTIILEVQGELYNIGDDELTFSEPELLFTPSAYFSHAETVVVRLLEAENLLGLPMEDVLEWRFFIDLEPPYASGESPRADSVLLSPPDTVSVILTEEYTTLVIDSVMLSVNGTPFTLDHPALSWDGFRLNLDLSGVSLFFPEGDSVTVTVSGAHDYPDYCPPNTMEPYTWRFLITSAPFWFPDTSGHKGDIIDIPLYSQDLLDLHITRLEIDVHFDPSVIEPLGIEILGTIAEGSTIGDLDTSGPAISFSVNSPVPLNGEGVLVYVRSLVTPRGVEGDFAPLFLDRVIMNEAFEGRTENGFFFIHWENVQWLFELFFYGTPPRIRGNTLSFGAGAGGSELYDPGMDIIALPIVPDMVHAYFPLEDTEFPYIAKLQRDIRGFEPLPITWYVNTYFEPAGIVRWHPEYLPPGEFIMDDILDMKVDSIWFFGTGEEIKIEFSRPLIRDYWCSLNYGWNLVSLPVFLTFSASATDIFPTILGEPYFYIDYSYRAITEIQKGQGYWIFSTSDTTYQVAGMPVNNYNRLAGSGWNLIGALQNPLPVSSLATNPPGAIYPNSCYEFDPIMGAYLTADTLKPWKGYWIALREACTLFVEPSAMARIAPTHGELKWSGKLYFENDDCTQILEFGFAQGNSEAISQWDKPLPPPLPGEGPFTAFRKGGWSFSSDFREFNKNAIWTLDLTKKLDNIHWMVRFTEEIESLLFHTPAGDAYNMFEFSEAVGLTEGTYTIEAIFRNPEEYKLSLRVWPNPFNETLRLDYSFYSEQPEGVQLSIFNILGEKVSSMVEERQEPGHYTILWDFQAAHHKLPTGIYFCNLKVNQEEKTLKALLLR